MNPLERWAFEEPIHTQLPVTLANGAVLSTFTVRCCRCQTELDPDHVRGEVKMRAGAAAFRMVDVCYNCKCVSYTKALAVPKKEGGYVLEFPANYPVAVPWVEDVSDYQKMVADIHEEPPAGEHGWTEIVDNMLKGVSVKH